MAKDFIVGIDLGGTNLKLGLLNLNYKIIDKNVLSTQKFIKRESLIIAIKNAIYRIIENNRLNKVDILGVGLGLPGPIDAKRGIVHFFPNICGWKEVNLKRILEKRLKLPVFLDNDANLMCLAEHRKGAAKGRKNVVCLTLGTGVGGGIIIENRLYRGQAYAAGEIGHIPLNENGPLCNCGGRACLESYIGNRRLIKAATQIYKRKISLEEIGRLAKGNDRRATKIWQDVGKKLGVALTGVVNLLNPDCIIIGGGLANVGKILFTTVKKTIKERAMSVQANYVKVFKAKLRDDAGLIGAAILVKEGLGR